MEKISQEEFYEIYRSPEISFSEDYSDGFKVVDGVIYETQIKTANITVPDGELAFGDETEDGYENLEGHICHQKHTKNLWLVEDSYWVKEVKLKDVKNWLEENQADEWMMEDFKYLKEIYYSESREEKLKQILN